MQRNHHLDPGFEIGDSPHKLSANHQIRFLTDDANVWSQNAWDHVPPPIGQEAQIAAALAKQRSAPVPEQDKYKYNEKPARHWFVHSRIYHKLCQ